MNTKRRSNCFSVAVRAVALLSVCSVLLVGKCALSQTAGTGAVAGTVLDSSGGLVAGAKVTVTSQATGESRTVASSSRGDYLVPALLPGLYTVAVSKDGFK